MPNKKAWFLRLFRLVWVTRHSCPGDHAAKAKTSSLDAFAFNRFAWFTVIAYCVASFAISPCRNWFIPIKKHTLSTSTQRYQYSGLNLHPCGVWVYFLVEMPGSAPGSTMPLLQRNYNNIVIIRHTYLCVNQIRPTTLFNLTAKSYSLSVHSFNKIMAYNNIPTRKIIATMPMLVVSFDVLTVCGRIASCRHIFQLTGSISFGR